MKSTEWAQSPVAPLLWTVPTHDQRHLQEARERDGSTADNPQPVEALTEWAQSAIVHPRYMRNMLSQALGLPSTASSFQRALRCSVLDARCEPGARCTILYQLGEHMVIAALRWPGAVHEVGAKHHPLDLRVYPFEQDPALPGLSTVLHPQQMVDVLNGALPACLAGEVQVLRCQVTLLRYRPGRRCTLRLDLGLRNRQTGLLQRQTVFGKLYHNLSKARSVYEEMQMLSACFTEKTPTLAGQLQLASAIAFVPELPLILQTPMTGMPLDLLLSHPERLRRPEQSRAWDGVHRAALALAALHGVGVTSSRLRPVTADIKKIQQRVSPVAPVNPGLSVQMGELMAMLSAGLERLARSGAEITLVHGDCKPSQFLLDEGRVGLLDFDHCGMADPAADVGTFLASLRQLAAGQALKTGQCCSWLYDLEQGFLGAYMGARGCGADFAWRATWYQAVALLRKAQRSFARSLRSPLPATLVEEGRRCLAVMDR